MGGRGAAAAAAAAAPLPPRAARLWEALPFEDHKNVRWGPGKYVPNSFSYSVLRKCFRFNSKVNFLSKMGVRR